MCAGTNIQTGLAHWTVVLMCASTCMGSHGTKQAPSMISFTAALSHLHTRLPHVLGEE